MDAKQKSKRAQLRLYPLKFDQVILDVLKVKPEPKQGRSKKSKPKAKRR